MKIQILKNLLSTLLLLVMLVGCSSQNKESLVTQLIAFEISECQHQCGTDSVGVRRNKIQGENLSVRLGYIVNCSWKYGYVDDITQRNDTLFLRLDRPHKIDTLKVDTNAKGEISYHIEQEYPHADCDCFFYFDLDLNGFSKTPRTIRVKGPFGADDFWDQKPIREIYEIQEVKEVLLSPVE